MTRQEPNFFTLNGGARSSVQLEHTIQVSPSRVFLPKSPSGMVTHKNQAHETSVFLTEYSDHRREHSARVRPLKRQMSTFQQSPLVSYSQLTKLPLSDFVGIANQTASKQVDMHKKRLA